MRLIDADALIEKMKQEEKECEDAMISPSWWSAKKIVNEAEQRWEEDVCEWEKGSSGYVGYPAYYSKCCTTNSKGLEMQTHIISDWKVCPYCGKKIKVVE